jgi:hypothetical protein
MKLLVRTLLFCIYIVFILVAHIFIINFLPYPFNHINFIFTISLLLITVSSDTKMLWLILIVSYCSELFSSMPFGVSTASLLISLLIINWFQLNILTNRSVYMIFLSAILGITLYRIVFIVLLTTHNYFLNLGALPYAEIIVETGWEILLSSLVLFILYAVNAKFIKFLRPSSRKNLSMYG